MMAMLVGLKAAHGVSSSSQLYRACMCVYVFINACLAGCAGVLACVRYTYFRSSHPFPKPPTSLPKRWEVKHTVSSNRESESTDSLKTFSKRPNSSLKIPNPFIFVGVCVFLWVHRCVCVCV